MIRDFYRGIGTDCHGRYLEEILSKSDDWFETCHDFIQWLFPLDVPSNDEAPMLTKEDIQVWQVDPALRNNLISSFQRILSFLGLKYNDKRIEHMNPVKPTTHMRVWSQFNHNWLRITRILKCLRLLGFQNEANDLFDFLVQVENRYEINSITMRYWMCATRGLPL